MDDCTREGYVEIKIAFDDHPDISKPWACGHILYIAEARGSQKYLDYIEWSETLAICFFRRIMVVSGGPSAASGIRAPTRPVAAANDAPPRKWRRE